MVKTPIERLRLDIRREKRILVITMILECAWQSYTSRHHDAWTHANPAMGQSDVTALLIRAKLGGEIRRSEVPGHGAYYYNVLADGRRLDLTRSKFPEGTVIPDGQPVDHQAMLTSDEAKASYLPERLSLLEDRFDYVQEALKRPKRKTTT